MIKNYLYTTYTITSHCDLCGREFKNDCQVVQEEYATEDVKYICLSCEKEVSEHLEKLRNLSYKWWQLIIRKFLKAKKVQK